MTQASVDFAEVCALTKRLQDDLISGLQALPGTEAWRYNPWKREGFGSGISAVIETPTGTIERGGVGMSVVEAKRLPPAATLRHPELADKPYRVTGVSCVLHPNSPHVPTAHLNIRCFVVGTGSSQVTWCGGGLDLTPHLVYEEDIIAWHRAIKGVMDVHDANWYHEFSENCNQYFSLPHRGGLRRGVGGVFFDDLALSQEQIARLFPDLINCFVEQWANIAKTRGKQAVSEDQRAFQLWWRGRYVEFNLLQDRGTVFGLQSGGRADSILISMPPLVSWHYPAGGVSEPWSEMEDRLRRAVGTDWNRHESVVG